jgi:F-type H+-transporting ATPase subunit delta
MKISLRINQQAKQLFRLCLRNGSLDEAVAQRLVGRLIQVKPRGCLAVLTAFERLVRLDSAQRVAVVETATPLPPEASKQVRDRLEQAYGPALNLSFSQNPALIGGMRVTVGSDVYDGSVQGRLAALEARFS